MPSHMNDAAGSEDQGAVSSADMGANLSPSEEALRELARVGEVPLAQAADPVGTVLGHFRVLAVLGRGGMGIVYRAEDETLRREVALKVLPPSVAGSAERRRRFLREARAAAALSHPNIAVVYEIGEAGEQIFIAMELIQGQSLAALLAGRRLPIDEALRVAREILSGLAKAHGAGIVHRDLKPDNVMIAADGHVKLLDFGIAKVLSEDGSLPSGSASTALTQEGGFVGTPLYMSPEQGKGLAVDARSDVFSFGVTLYEMLTGERPFAGASLIELLVAIDRDEPAAPSRKTPAISAALERIVLRCLQKDPAARYANAGELLRELEQVRGSASPSGLRQKGILAAITALVLISVAAWVLFRGRAATTGPAPVISASSAPAAPVPTVLTDLPVPSSRNAEALAAYRRGILKLRRGEGLPHVEFRSAIARDPSLGAAYVQLAVLGLQGSGPHTRDHARKAQEHRASLAERDAALLDAVDPAVRGEPPDVAETIRRLTKLLERWPGDAQIWHLRGIANDEENGLPDVIRAIELDPHFGMAHAIRGQLELQLGRIAEGRRTLERCLEIIPTSTACMAGLGRLAIHEGDCKGLETLARRIVAADPQVTGGHAWLANALAAQGQPLATVREAVRQWENVRAQVTAHSGLKQEEEERSFMQFALVGNKWRLAVMAGDFASADIHARELEQVFAASQQQLQHGWAALWRSWTLLEIGQEQQAARVAVEFLERRHAWERPAGLNFGVPFHLVTALRGRKITRGELIAQRDAWLLDESTRTGPTGRGFLWMHGYAATADGPDAAREAITALPQYEPLPPFDPGTRLEAAVGRTFLLAGRVDDAITWLRHATRRCHVLDDFFEQTQAYLWLGQALEQKGDNPGACKAYRVVLDRWGTAKPRSVTAEEARRRAQAIGCKR